jgi:hypothetical protein
MYTILMAKQLKKFCRITKYIEKTDPKLHEILDNLCLLGAFRTRRGHMGLTFVWPAKETIAKLEKIMYTDDIDKGCDIILAHIIHDYLPSGAVWNTKKSDIPNGLNKKIEIKSAAGTKVELADGAVLELDAKFKTFSRNAEHEAVWRVVKGELDYTKHTKPASYEHARMPLPGQPKRAPAPVKGGSAGQKDLVKVYIDSLATTIATKEAKSTASPFSFLVDFYHFVEKANDAAALDQLKLILSPHPVTCLAFVTRDNNAVLAAQLENFRLAITGESEYNKNMYGLDEYMEIVRINQAEHASGTQGGGRREALIGALNRAIDAANNGSEEVRAKFSNALSAREISNLNLARSCEMEAMRSISTNKTLTERADIHAELAEMADIIVDRANNQTTDTDAVNQKLGVLIASLLDHVDKFTNGPYAKYPIEASAAETTKAAEAVVRRYHTDNSVTSVLKGMSAEKLSEIFTTLGKS